MDALFDFVRKSLLDGWTLICLAIGWMGFFFRFMPQYAAQFWVGIGTITVMSELLKRILGVTPTLHPIEPPSDRLLDPTIVEDDEPLIPSVHNEHSLYANVVASAASYAFPQTPMALWGFLLMYHFVVFLFYPNASASDCTLPLCDNDYLYGQLTLGVLFLVAVLAYVFFPIHVQPHQRRCFQIQPEPLYATISFLGGMVVATTLAAQAKEKLSRPIPWERRDDEWAIPLPLPILWPIRAL